MKHKKLNSKLIKSKIKNDIRGSLDKFVELKVLNLLKFKIKEIQISKSRANVFRGFYMQTGRYNEAKLIKILKGSLIWFGIDLRKKSKSFGSINIYNLRHNEILYLPRGFAHGSYSKTNSEILIMADNIYNNKFSIGINYKDKKFFKKIKKYFKNKKPIVSNWHNNYKNFEEAVSKLN